MANMSYCMFENTYADLLDCYDALENKSADELSHTERKHAIKLIEMCIDISENAEDFLERLEYFKQ